MCVHYGRDQRCETVLMQGSRRTTAGFTSAYPCASALRYSTERPHDTHTSLWRTRRQNNVAMTSSPITSFSLPNQTWRYFKFQCVDSNEKFLEEHSNSSRGCGFFHSFSFFADETEKPERSFTPPRFTCLVSLLLQFLVSG